MFIDSKAGCEYINKHLLTNLSPFSKFQTFPSRAHCLVNEKSKRSFASLKTSSPSQLGRAGAGIRERVRDHETWSLGT